MTIEKIPLSQFIPTLKVIHIALIMGQLVFAGVVIFLENNGTAGMARDLGNIFLFLALIFTGGGIFGSRAFYKYRITFITPDMPFEEKLSNFRIALITKYAILEAPSFIALVGFLITANYLILLFAGLVVAVFVMEAPTLEKISLELKLSDEEKILLKSSSIK
ncbi:MAG: hypothetical protein P1P88_02965 [Bacteroidales bacterium]|nr:hypothetical protein [Bacteroidales bacterium]